MNRREAQATIDELARECNRLEAENEALYEQLSAMRHCLGQLVRLSSGLHASILDEFVKSRLLEEQTRKGKGGSDVSEATTNTIEFTTESYLSQSAGLQARAGVHALGGETP